MVRICRMLVKIKKNENENEKKNEKKIEINFLIK